MFCQRANHHPLHFINSSINTYMNGNSIISTQLHSYTLVASYTEGAMRINIEVNHSPDVLFVSNKFTNESMPTELKVLFENASGFYEYLYKVISKNMSQRIVFKNNVLKIKVFIEGKMRSIPIKMRKMIQDKQNKTQDPFLLTSIASQVEDQTESRVSTGWLSKLQNQGASGPRLKLMVTRENNRFRKAITKIPEVSTSSVTKNTRQYPYLKPQTYSRYNKVKTQDQTSTSQQRKSFSEGKTMYTYQRSLNLKKNMKENNLDLSNTELRVGDIKELISYDWNKLILLNVGYNNIGSEGLKLLTSIRWPSLRTLYVCFNNIYRVEWQPENICFLKTLSMSGNKIKQIPKNIIALQFLQQLFIYNNRIEVIPEQLSYLEQLKNLSIYGNKLDHIKCRQVLVRLKSRKVQVWQ